MTIWMTGSSPRKSVISCFDRPHARFESLINWLMWGNSFVLNR